MSKSIIRLAALLQKDTLTAAERREGINLAQAMFRTGAVAQLDSTVVALRSKRISGLSDPAGLTAPGRHVVIGKGKDTEIAKSADTVQRDKPEDEVKSDPQDSEFEFMGDKYTAKVTKSGQTQYRRNGKVIKKADWAKASLEVAAGIDEES